MTIGSQPLLHCLQIFSSHKRFDLQKQKSKTGDILLATLALLGGLNLWTALSIKLSKLEHYVKFWRPLFLALKFTFLFLKLAKIQIFIPKSAYGGGGGDPTV